MPVGSIISKEMPIQGPVSTMNCPYVGRERCFPVLLNSVHVTLESAQLGVFEKVSETFQDTS